MIIGTDPFETEFDLAGASIGFGEYDASTQLVGVPRETYEADSLLRAQPRVTYLASSRIGIPTPTYQADAIIVYDADDPRVSESFINTFWWAYGDQYQKVDREIQMMVHRLKLDYATGDDLDEYWGPVLGIRRRALEGDEDYRSRLAIHIRTVTSSGTSANIRAVIDRITGYAGGSVLETFSPAYLKLSWANAEIAKIAETKNTQITSAMDRAVAAGVSWSTGYPYAEYDIDYTSEGTEVVTYSASVAVAKRRGVQYWATTGLWEAGSETYDADVMIYSPMFVTYKSKAQLYATGTATYQAASKIYSIYGWSHTSDYEAGGWKSKTIKRAYMMAATLETET